MTLCSLGSWYIRMLSIRMVAGSRGAIPVRLRAEKPLDMPKLTIAYMGSSGKIRWPILPLGPIASAVSLHVASSPTKKVDSPLAPGVYSKA